MRPKRRSSEQIHDRLAEIPAAQVGHMVVAVVDDPYSTVGGKISVRRSVRDDPLAGLLARGSIDMAQYEAGRTWQRHWENACIGAVRGIDPTKEPVDGKGPSPAPFSDRQREAFAQLRDATAALGHEGDWIVRRILGERATLFEVAVRRHRSKKYIGQRFRECLETLAKIWCLA